MRLTLRTLLAYLDDILDAAQTKEIGARISENSTASALVERIREVTRRRRIGSPELSGPGSTPDPNVVAEYLDNTLEPAAVGDLERVCLDSDMHLVEVAACHQILTIVLGEPVTIRPELRERMYAMGAVAPGPGQPSLNPAPYAVGSARPVAARPVVPEYLKRPPVWKKLVPLALVILLVAGWGYLVAGFFDSDQTDVVTTVPPVVKSKQEPQAPKPTDKAPTRRPVDRTADQVAAAVPPPAPVPIVIPEMDDAPLPADAPPVVAAAVDAAPAAVADATSPAPPAPGITPPAADDATQSPVPTVMYTSTEGVLMHRPRGRQDWTTLPRRALLHIGDEIASPDPFVGDLQISSPADPALALRVSLQGGARVRLLPPTGEMLAELEINRGRVAVFRGVDGVPHALGIGVTVAGLRTEFDAVSPQTRFGLFVELPQPKGVAPEADQWPAPAGTLFVTSGSVNVRRANLPPISGDASVQLMEWTNPTVDGFSPGTVPLWLDPEAKALASQKNWSRAYQDEFNLDLPVQNSIGPVAEQDKRNTVATYAARTLSLIDDVTTLVRVLTSPHEDTRFAAMQGLREWVMMSPEHPAQLEDEISRVFRDQEAPVVVKLLWRVSEEEARNETASMQVVECLASDNIAIRDLAYYEVLRLANRDLGYRPQNPAGQREPALMRWRDLVRRNKGLIPTVPDAEAPVESPDNRPMPPATDNVN